MDEYSEDLKSRVKASLSRLRAADDGLQIKHFKGELTGRRASSIGGNVAVAVDGVMLDVLESRELAETIDPILLERVEEGRGSGLPYVHLLPMLALRHRLEMGDRAPKPGDVQESVETLREEVDLANITEQKAELADEAEEKVNQLGKRWKENRMFGLSVMVEAVFRPSLCPLREWGNRQMRVGWNLPPLRLHLQIQRRERGDFCG